MLFHLSVYLANLIIEGKKKKRVKQKQHEPSTSSHLFGI